MKRPGKPLAEHYLLESAAAEIKTKCFCVEQAKGILHTYEIDDSWVKDTMTPWQIAEAVGQRADDARYFAKCGRDL